MPGAGQRRAGTRPARRSGNAARGTARTGPTSTVPRMFSARVMTVGVVALLAFVLVFPTLRSYLDQRAELARLHAEVTAAQGRTADLSAELARWSDDRYVTAQARERLSFVMPGETAYHVADPESVTGAAPAAGAGRPGDATAVPTAEPWYQRVWSTVEQAGGAPAPSPASSVPDGTP